ncbi:hypothetical protein BOTBODRAFT_157888 [Botryobasidium botryosum FD-172 SS1]|uniref:RNA-dependent RNA polymerase n=1 Tax=Botryobasidium botryosum (strain FD-172 SS1) TaxID=930990 RepID=A0A067MIJ0_BOTB1|nr:hypothetical protein BOTBODRAFT_157888 [Botryobasidium botryosum FD-172 SS1]
MGLWNNVIAALFPDSVDRAGATSNATLSPLPSPTLVESPPSLRENPKNTKLDGVRNKSTSKPTFASQREAQGAGIPPQQDASRAPKAPLIKHATADSLGGDRGDSKPPKITENGPGTSPLSLNVPRRTALNVSDVRFGGSNRSGYVEIAHSRQYQRCFDARKLSWGVQWEIARLVSHGLFAWDDIRLDLLDDLKGTNANAAPKVVKQLLPALNSNFRYFDSVQSNSPRLPWEELDLEQDAIVEGKNRGLGCSSDDNWFGGKIQQRATITLRSSPVLHSSSLSPGDRFEIRLAPQEKGRSTRFGRAFGSRRLIQVSASKDIMYKHLDELMEYMTKGFVINGRVFRAFFAKDNHIYLTETAEDYERKADPNEGDHFRLSLIAFIDWFAPLHLNNRQLMSKWSTRFGLLLSTSLPGVPFHNTNIHIIPDEYGSSYQPEDGQPAAEQIMTDGCGFINLAALKQIKERLELGTIPSAVQARLAGAKGMWLRHPTDQDPQPKIWLRDSQIKVNVSFDEGGRTYILDVVRAFFFKCPANLSTQVINNLSYNGVPNDVFVKLMVDGLGEEVQPFDWTQPGALVRLWAAVHDIGGVLSTKIRRDAATYARLLGAETWDSDKPKDMDVDGPLSGGMDEISGHPDTKYERVIGLLEAGFTPQQLPILRDDVKSILHDVVEKYVKKYRIPVPMSLTAFIVPDPLGVLEAHQVHFRASQPELLTPSGDLATSISGDVLLTRIPLMLPTDVKKMVVLDHHMLNSYVDVLVFPIKGDVSLASGLSGGDYDGDTATMFWDPSIVSNFSPGASPGTQTDPNDSLVSRPPESVVDFAVRVASMSEDEGQQAYQEHFLCGLNRSQIGFYSNFHTNAVYALGYGHPQTLRLANLYAVCLDSQKTGKSVKPEVFKKDQGAFGRRKPPCMESEEEFEKSQRSDRPPRLPRDQALPVFALDALATAGKAEATRHLTGFDKLLKNHTDLRPDPVLTAPYEDAKERASLLAERGHEGMKAELKQLRTHVKKLAEEYSALKARAAQEKVRSQRGSQGTTPSPQPNDFRRLSQAFLEGASYKSLFFSQPEVLRVMASYAYRHEIVTLSHGYDCSFSFAVAFRELCAIKAGRQRTILSREFSDLKVPHRGALRLLSYQV